MNLSAKVMASAATLLLAVCVMPKPVSHVDSTPSAEIGCVSTDGGESCDRMIDADLEYPTCWEEDQATGPCVWDARLNGGISYFVEADGHVELLYFP